MTQPLMQRAYGFICMTRQLELPYGLWLVYKVLGSLL